MSSTSAPLTDRVNVEPPILNGMTVSEAQIIGLVALVLCFLLGLLVFAATGYWQAILVLSLFGTGLTLWLASGYLAGLKRDRPDGYYSQRLHIWLAARGVVTPRLITHHGYWDLGGSLGLHLSADLSGEAALATTPPANVQLAQPSAQPKHTRLRVLEPLVQRTSPT